MLPGSTIGHVPFFLLPIVWGLWNLLWARWTPAIGIGGWGALLGIAAGILVNLLFLAEGTWFRPASVLPLFLAVVYYLIFRLVVGPLNEGLGVEGARGDR